MLWHLFGFSEPKQTWEEDFIKVPNYIKYILYILFDNYKIPSLLIHSKFLFTNHIISLILHAITSKV